MSEFGMEIIDAKFCIIEKNLDKAFKAVIDSNVNEKAYVSHDVESEDLQYILSLHGLSMESDSKNNLQLDDISPYDEESDVFTDGNPDFDMKGLFDVIAPFVKKGSYIHMIEKENFNHYKWLFDGKKCVEIPGKVSFTN